MKRKILLLTFAVTSVVGGLITNTFLQQSGNSPQNYLKNLAISKIVKTNSDVYVATNNAIYQSGLKKLNFKLLFNDFNAQTTINGFTVFKNNIYIAANNGFYYGSLKAKHLNVLNSENSNFQTGEVFSVKVFQNKIYVGAQDALYVGGLNITKKSFTYYSSIDLGAGNSADIYSISINSKTKQLALAGSGSGLIVGDLRNGKYQFTAFDDSYYSQVSIYTEQVQWVGTSQSIYFATLTDEGNDPNGVGGFGETTYLASDTSLSNFKFINQSSNSNYSDNNTYSFSGTGKGTVLTGTDNGVNVVNVKANFSLKGATLLQGNGVSTIAYVNGNAFIGTIKNGLYVTKI